MRTAANRIAGHGQSKGMMRVAGPLWDATVQYPAGAVVAFAGHTWSATVDVGRGHAPQGVGDGSTANRDILLSRRNGHAAAVTGGYTGATYTVTRSDDALSGSVPTAGTLRYGLSGQANIAAGGNYWDPLWIVFDAALGTVDIQLTQTAAAYNPCYIAPNKTVDGRGFHGRVVFPRNDSVPLQGFTHAGVKNPNQPGRSAWNVDGNGYTGTSNVIWAYLTVRNLSVASVNCEVFAGSGYGSDLIWFHHVDAAGGADGVMDQLMEADYIVQQPAAGIHVENVLKRVTIDWCHLGPHPIADALMFTYNQTVSGQMGALLGADNQANDGKISLCGLPPKDGYRADNLRITAHHNHWYGGQNRNPKTAVCRYHMFNNWVDHYGGGQVGMESPTFMVADPDLAVAVPGGTAHGWSPALLATLDTARHSNWPYPVWNYDELDHKSFGYGGEASRDGELLSENDVFTGYTTGEDHLLNDDLIAAGFITSGQRWKIGATKTNAIQAIINHGQDWVDPIVLCRGPLFEGSAGFGPGITVIGGVGYSPNHTLAGLPFGGVSPLYRGWRNGHYNSTAQTYVGNTNWTWKQDSGVNGDGGAGPDWGGVPPYDYLLYTADSTLKADLTRGSGNVQPWQFIA